METESEEFLCPEEGCGKRFKRKEHLVRHSATHNDVKAFACGICGKAFARSDVLNRHVRQHGADATATAGNAMLNACDACHARKAKCTGGNPCHFCAGNDLACTRDRAVARHRATKEAQKTLANPTVVPPNESEGQISGWMDDTLMEEVGLDTSTSPSTTAASQKTSSSTVSTFDGLPFSLPHGISETPYHAKDQEGLLQTCWRSLEDPTPTSPYELGLEETLLDQFLVAYFSHLYQRWPLIHIRTFNKRQAPPLLIWTLVMAGARLVPPQKGTRELADCLQLALFPLILRWLEAVPTHDSAQILLGLQAATLYTIFSLYFGDETQLLLACQVNDRSVDCLRSIGAYDPEAWTKEIPWADPMSSQWIQIETRKRLTSLAFFANMYLAILLDKEPTMQYLDLNCRLPCRNYWWWAMSREEIQRLHMADRPSDRTPKTMARFISDTLAEDKVDADVDVRELEVVDCHLVQCVMQVLVWQANDRARESEAARAHTRGYFTVPEDDDCTLEETKRAYWASNLDFWKSIVEREYWKRQRPNVSKHELFPRTLLESINLTLYNFSMMSLHSDLRTITKYVTMISQPHALPASAEELTATERKVTEWAGSSHGRLSAYQAGQILRHCISPEFTFRIGTATLEPITKVALFHAALVMWAFTFRRQACPACTADWQPERKADYARKVTLETGFPYDPDFVKRWVLEDGRMLLLDIAICRCSIHAVLGLFELELHRYGEIDVYTQRRAAFVTALQAANVGPDY